MSQPRAPDGELPEPSAVKVTSHALNPNPTEWSTDHGEWYRPDKRPAQAAGLPWGRPTHAKPKGRTP